MGWDGEIARADAGRQCLDRDRNRRRDHRGDMAVTARRCPIGNVGPAARTVVYADAAGQAWLNGDLRCHDSEVRPRIGRRYGLASAIHRPLQYARNNAVISGFYRALSGLKLSESFTLACASAAEM